MTAKAPPAEATRYYAPRGIAALLIPVLRPALNRRGAALATLIADWAGIVGPDIAARSLPVKFAAGTLTIGCAGPDALTFQHMAPTLVGRINMVLGGAPVERLRFSDLTIEPPARPIGKPERELLIAPPAKLPEGPLGEALARLHAGLDRRRRNHRL